MTAVHAPATREPRVAVRPDAAAPLSYGQQRMWMLSELSHGAAALTVVMAVRLTGRLNVPALRQALDDVVARHEVLRSVIVVVGGEPVQRPVPQLRVPFQLVDLGGLPAAAAADRADELLRGAAAHPFDLAAGPLARATLIALGPREHVLAVGMHHAATDAWSASLLAGEVSALYRAYLAGRPGELADRPAVQYREFARWQRAVADEPTGELAEWIDRLRDLTGGGLPLDRPPTDERSRAAAIWTCTLPPSMTNRLGELRRREGGSLFMLVLAALMTVIHRVDGRGDVAVGMFSAGRTRPEFESVLGYFVNVLVVRCDFGAATTFREAWRQVRERCVAAYVHQDLPYERLLEHLSPDRSAQLAPPVSVLCVMQQPAPHVELPDLVAEPIDVPHATARFDLTVEVRERAGVVELAFQYDTDVLDAGTVELLGRYVRGVLAGAAADLDAPCAAIALDPAVRPAAGNGHLPAAGVGHRPAAGAGATGHRSAPPAAESADATLHGLFELRAELAPDAVAVSHRGAALTCRTLNAMANRLARHLVAAGVGLDDRVGICLPRSLGSVAAMLAVLKAGAGYLPLDPAAPAERLAGLVADAGARVVLTTADLAPRFAGLARTVLAADAGGHPAGDLRLPVSPDNLAYLLYTSGSTGRPKGVLGTHRGMVNRLRWMWRSHPYRPGERACHRTPLGFVDSVTELLGPLLGGIPVEIVDDDQVVDPGRLADAISAAGVTRMIVVPSLLRVLVDTVADLHRRLPAHGVWVSSGERLPAELADRFHRALPGRVLLNLYGSTEIAGDATAAPIPAGAGSVPIGRPIDAMTAEVVEPNGRAAPSLVAGELWVGGPGVARGYHGRPGETAARFGPGPGGGRVFRTGDRARVSAAGELHFLGRLDDQVQVRGARVEPGEIEDALRRHPEVAQAAVAAWPDAAGSASLVGYVVLRSPCPAEALLAFLRDRLPPHLVPSVLLPLDELPHTSSGKVDRRRLPPPADVPAERATVAVEPRDPAERAVAEVFAELLPVPWRSLDDDFFGLGGHSILAIAAVHQIKQRCGVELGMRDIFAARTIAGLARRVEQAATSAEAGPLRPRPEEQYEPFPLTEVQQAYWIGRDSGLELGSVATHAYFEVHAPELDVDRLATALDLLVRRHPALRTVVRPDGLQQVLREVPRYRLPVADLRSVTAGERERRLVEIREELSHQVLPADRWPLFDIRASLLPDPLDDTPRPGILGDTPRPGGPARLHVSIDALVADAYSVRVLMDELAALYHDPSTELAPIELTFRDCVVADDAARRSPAYDSALDYWRQRLRTLPPGPELPLVRSPGSLDQPRFRRWSAVLPPAAWDRLRQRAADEGLSPPAVLLAAFAEVLTAWSARPHYTLTLTLFSRQHGHPDVDRVVGDFTSLNLLEVDHRERQDFVAGARRLQEQMWADLDRRLVSGVTVMREWTRLRGGRPGLLAPVVFTSNLGLDPEPSDGRSSLHRPGGRNSLHRPGGRPPAIGELGFALTQTPQLYLDYQVADGPDGLALSWDVVAELFPPGLVDDMHGAYLRLLTELADGSRPWDSPVAGLLPRPQLERRAAANATAAPPETACLYDLVAGAAARDPLATAVIDGDRRLSYRELSTMAARVCHRLRALGAGPGELVGVAAAKGWEQVVAVLGIAASGAAYVPVDPALPAARMELLRRQTGLRFALTQTAMLDRLPGLSGARLLAVDDEAQWADWPDSRPEPLANDRALAYVIFTSGSTGVPKGVMIDHHGAVNTVVDINRRFEVGAGDRVLGLSSLSFDLSVYDIFGVLGAGGALVLPDPQRLRDPAHWVDLVERERVTLWNSVPALMGLAVERPGGAAGLRGLRLVMLSGDWIPVDLPDRVRRVAPAAEVVSLGGATEGSIWSVFHPVGRVDPAAVSIPYGRPLANQRLHVLDGWLEPRPDWVPGDLYIAGDGVAVGYWADRETTARSFLVHPGTGERLYRTGDLARYLPDGDLEFLGREDRQVKISGYRVELGEIESALAQVPGVAAGAVTAIGSARGEKRLAAYYVAEAGAGAPPIDPATVRDRLRAALPAYLVPTTCTELPALPLTANGKVDVAALSRAESAPPPAAGDRPLPASEPLLSALAQLWATVLGVERVGPDDSFFELGGTSLVAVRLLARLEAGYGVKIPLVRLYEAPTVAQLAGELAGLLDQGPSDEPADGRLVPDPEHRADPFPLTPIQEAYWMGRHRALELGGVATHSYVELDVTGLDVDRLERAVRALVARHDALRTVVLPDGRQRVLTDLPEYRIARTDLRQAPADQARRTLDEIRARLSHRVQPADRWPLFDISATLLDAERTRVHVGVDLLIADALSFQILRGELLACYQREAAELPPLGCTFRDYVLAVERLRGGASARRAQRYWTDRVATLPPAPRLPLLRPLGELGRPRFERLHGAIEAADWERLKRSAAARNLTPSGLLCAAFGDVLAMWSQCGRFTVNLTTFNRLPLHADVDAVVGDFTSTTLLAVDATPATFAARAGVLQQQIFRDLDHRQFGGVEVLRLLRADAARRADALAPIVFTSMLLPEPAAAAGTAAPWRAEPVFSVSQTPQVLLDHQVYEHDGALAYTWDHVADAFPPGMIDAMFDAYGRLLRSLHTDGAYWEAAPAWTT